MDIDSLISFYVEGGPFNVEDKKSLAAMVKSYIAAGCKQKVSYQDLETISINLLKLIAEQVKNPFTFPLYHERCLEPYNFSQFGIDFFVPLIDKEKSFIQGIDNLRAIRKALKEGKNIILLSNHQIEGDPQVIQLLLRYFFNQSLEEHLIFVAGERVLQDPMAVPFSRGCNLLCIYSNKYIEHPPEKKVEKRRHNQKTMKTMRDLLDDGGQCIYVAPSGGRDRKNREGIVNVATFEPQSVEIFYLMGKKSSKETLFVPFSLDTYDILPPPDSINIDIGESRTFNSQGSALSFGSFIDMETIAGVNAHENLDKQAFRKLRAEAIWKIVSEQYVEINRLLNN